MALQEMSEVEKRELLKTGATLVFLNVPKGTEFGIDYMSWTVDKDFCGIKMIPPGVHFIYYSARGTEGQLAPRTGFFHDFAQEEVLIRKYDRAEEDVSLNPMTDEEKNASEENKKKFDRFMAPYPFDSYPQWKSLTNFITSDVLGILNPPCGKIHSSPQFESKASTTQSRKEDSEKGDTETRDEDGLPNLIPLAESKINFTPFPKRMYPENSTPEEITRHSMDPSWFLEKRLKEYVDVSKTDNGDVMDGIDQAERHILGELQFAFVVFLIGQQYEAFEQWKKLVSLFCKSDNCTQKKPKLFATFIRVIYFQIPTIHGDFFVDITDASDNFLVANVRTLLVNCETSGDSVLAERSRKFRGHLESKYGWVLPVDEEDGDDAPACDEQYEQLLQTTARDENSCSSDEDFCPE